MEINTIDIHGKQIEIYRNRCLGQNVLKRILPLEIHKFINADSSI